MAGPISLLRRLFTGASEEPSRPGPLDPFWYGAVDGSAAGQVVTAETSMQVGAVYRAVSVLANAVAQIPLLTYERLEFGKERATAHPLYRVLKLTPNPWQSSFEWRRLVMAQVLLRGNAYSIIISDPAGRVVGLYPLRPERMRVEQLGSWRLRYQYTWEDGRQTTFLQEDILHIRALSTDGICGLSPVTLARTTFGTAIALGQYSARQFSQAPKISGLLEVPGEVTDDVERQLSTSFRAAWSGSRGWFGVPVLHSGMKWQSVGMSNADAEFLASRKFEVSEIARWFGVPTHLLYDNATQPRANMEHLGIDFVTYSLMPWLVNIEQRLAIDLFDAADDYFAEFLVDGLLRGDGLSRAQKQEIYLRNGVVCPDEVRAQENMNPRADGRGGEYLMQVNATRPIEGASPQAPEPPHAPDGDEDPDAGGGPSA